MVANIDKVKIFNVLGPKTSYSYIVNKETFWACNKKSYAKVEPDTYKTLIKRWV